MSNDMWDQRYSGSELVWSSSPNIWVEQLTSDLPPGRALDLAAGEGRNAIWLAEQGWQATAIDFSQVALDRAKRLAADRFGDDASRFHTERADLTDYSAPAREFDLVLVVYLQIPADQRRLAIRAAAAAVAVDGRLIVIAHDSTNLANGVGGPQDPNVLYTAQDVVDDLTGTGLEVARAETVARSVPTDSGNKDALDAVVVAVRGNT
jgi:SAM-dependent methyltransferase